NDNRVSLPDFSVLASTFGRSSGSTGYDGRADFSGDGVINLRDFSLLAKHFDEAGAADPSPAEPRPSHSVIRAQQVVPNLTAGASVTLDVAMNAPPTTNGATKQRRAHRPYSFIRDQYSWSAVRPSLGRLDGSDASRRSSDKAVVLLHHLGSFVCYHQMFGYNNVA
uniref:hypothetical protein n=1 Tax=Candidatus Chloroploca sp. Khr17 TaxID=2496869 RepID=UPI0013EA468D